MRLLVPLGLLGLLGVVALIILYIIKPNYQQKNVSSTYIWQLSLKYRKKKLPTSKLRNLLLIICQVLIIVISALVLTKPVIALLTANDSEMVIVIDSSASMRMSNSAGETRFERAVEGAKEKALAAISEGGMVSVIIADYDPHFIAQGYTENNRDQLTEAFDDLLIGETACAYGKADVDKAMDLCEQIIRVNPSANICFYTDRSYYVNNDITVENVAAKDYDVWNAAILDAYVSIDDGYYSVTVEVACYGANKDLTVKMDVFGANSRDNDDEGVRIPFSQEVTCYDDLTQKVVFKYGDLNQFDSENETVYPISEAERFKSYRSIHIFLQSYEGGDSFDDDNSFDIYGGQKEVLKIQYASSLLNNYMQGILDVLKTKVYADRWDIQVDYVRGDGFALDGYDCYIFEHIMPTVMPADGVVFLLDPETVPMGADINFNSYVSFGVYNMALTADTPHEIMYKVEADNITVNKYTKLAYYDLSYDVLMRCGNDPVVLARKDGESSTFLMMFSLHYSNLPLLREFPTLMYNLIEYYIPTTVKGNAFEVSQNVSLKTRGGELTVTGGYSEYGTNDAVVAVDIPGAYTINDTTHLPVGGTVVFTMPGTYTIEQEIYTGKISSTNIFVRIPAEESNINPETEVLRSPYREIETVNYYRDLLLYFAIALVAIMFAERLLRLGESV